MDYWLVELAGSLGRLMVLILPVGFLYGKLYRKLHFRVIIWGWPLGAVLDVIGQALAPESYSLLVGAIACAVGIEAADSIARWRKQPTKA